MGEVGGRVERVVRGVVAAAVRESGAEGVVVLEDGTPEGELVHGWLAAELGAGVVARASAVAGNVQEAVDRNTTLLAHPVNRTALLLGGAPPRADLLPLGDVYASQVEVLAGGWSAPADVERAARAAGGVAALDAALTRWIDGREEPATALAGLDAAAAGDIVRLYERGRWFRLRPRLVPKLGARTLGIDLWD